MAQIPKYIYEEPVLEAGIEIGVRIHTYTDSMILEEYWDIWCSLKKKAGFDEKELCHQDCINDWVAHFNAHYVN